MSSSDDSRQRQMPPTPIQISSSFAEHVGEDGVGRFVDIIAEIDPWARGRAPDEVADELVARLERADLVTDDLVNDRIAEILANPGRGEAAVMTDDGRPLLGDPDTKGGKPGHRDPDSGPMFS